MMMISEIARWINESLYNLNCYHMYYYWNDGHVVIEWPLVQRGLRLFSGFHFLVLAFWLVFFLSVLWSRPKHVLTWNKRDKASLHDFALVLSGWGSGLGGHDKQRGKNNDVREPGDGRLETMVIRELAGLRKKLPMTLSAGINYAKRLWKNENVKNVKEN